MSFFKYWISRADTMRFYLDYRQGDKSLYDYDGDDFLSLGDVCEFAIATAQSLKHSLSDDWSGWSVEVRNPQGNMVFSVIIGKSPVVGSKNLSLAADRAVYMATSGSSIRIAS
jgi:hypothetical protein